MIDMSLAVLLAQQGVPDAGAGSLVSTALDMVMKGGWIMLPLGVCSLVALTITVERWIVTRASRVAPRGLADELRTMRGDPHASAARCERDASPLGAVVSAALRAGREPRALQEARMAEAGQREMLKLRKRTRLLSALPQTATMLGLLGTVFGMIRTFTVIAASGESLGKTERLAQGIYEAWTATAAGLVVAIPALLAYHFIMGRIDAAAAALDVAAASWFEAGSAAVVTVPAPAVLGAAAAMNGDARLVSVGAAVPREAGAC